ncbi:MAG TPA: SUMF1/EgtB/PvdO family nonheme iron enzyme [Bryobacteraceae bacterium]|nr:SUMF1/EgtB/PvdO family nonheme iron enzyme [Bryobacteraceae bacterium]
MKLFAVLLLPLTLCAQQNATAPTGHRYALVVGNSDYAAPLPPLPEALADARLIAEKLTAAGFNVTLVENGIMPDLLIGREAEFLKQLSPGDVVFFYYSGYAVQGEEEDDYLLPVNFNPQNSISSSTALSLARVIGDLKDTKAKIKFVMIEGPPPLPQLDVPIKGATGLGLLRPDMNDLGEVLYAAASQPGQVVSFKESGAGLYTEEVAAQIDKPGLLALDVFQQASTNVTRQTGLRQNPFVNSTLISEFYFHAPLPQPPPPPPAPPSIISNRRDREEYVYIPPGKFKMGCVPADTRCEPGEKPQHEVTISKGFYLGRTEVEVRAYQRFVDAKKLKMPSAPLEYHGWKTNTNFPMVMVKWEQARDYCAWAGGRLPTEAEWEYAARGGASEEVYPLNDENSRDKANFYGKGGNDTFEGVAPVRSFDANPYNLFDMAGNVWEWVEDWYDPKYYAQSPDTDPRGPDMGKEHVARGGSFDSDPKQHLRLSFRRPQGMAQFNVGFRCILEDTAETQK